ncbi:MAG: hypothetical protein P4L16_07425 [Chlamydiales bacterium]|nr:hypothetical protein [Chlamydiales bacterium]
MTVVPYQYQSTIATTYQGQHLSWLEEHSEAINPTLYPIVWTKPQFSKLLNGRRVFKILEGNAIEPSVRANLPRQNLCELAMRLDKVSRECLLKYKIMLIEAVEADKKKIEALERMPAYEGSLASARTKVACLSLAFWRWCRRHHYKVVQPEGCCHRITCLKKISSLEGIRINNLKQDIEIAAQEIGQSTDKQDLVALEQLKKIYWNEFKKRPNGVVIDKELE